MEACGLKGSNRYVGAALLCCAAEMDVHLHLNTSAAALLSHGGTPLATHNINYVGEKLVLVISGPTEHAEELRRQVHALSDMMRTS